VPIGTEYSLPVLCQEPSWEAQTDILALEILEDGSILALESSQQQFITFIAHIVSERIEKDAGELFLPGSLR
jgi:hypothetical protein